MATTVTRQTSVSDIHAYYASPPSPKSPAFVKGHSGRRPSFSVTSWLGRSSGQAASLTSSPTPRVIQISDPQPTNPYDAAAKAPGALGKGATVVRTPHQALNTSTFSYAETPNEKDELETFPVTEIKAPAPKPIAPLAISAIHRRDSPVSRRESPVPRRESPTPSQASAVPSALRTLHSSKSYSHLQTSPRKATASPPPRAPPMPLNLASSRQPLLRSALSKPPSPTKTTSGPFLPLLPPPKAEKVTPPSSPLPPFHPVLMSSVPTHPAPPSQIIVTLETSTVSQRTTVATLISRPSRLASYLQALVPSANKDDSDSSFSSLFAAHLAQAGLVPQAQTSYSGPIQIFLDRPSAPYAHILTYLRSGTNVSGVLPRAASLALNSDPARVEALCELRDEARYLELSELVELCDKELRARAPKLRSTASTSSLREFKFGSGSEGSGGARTSSVAGEAVEARLREYRFGAPSVEALPEEVDEEENSMQLPPVVYEKKGSHAGTVLTAPPRGLQLSGSKPPSVRAPLSQGRTRTISDVRYHTSDQKTWI